MTKQQTILLVEDNKKLNDINRRALLETGCDVLTAATLAQARRLLADHSPDVILLDILLPDGNGMAFCSEIRQATDAHIIFLTSRNDFEDKIRGLDTGGDDYITKPYRLEELISRVRSVLRRREMKTEKPPDYTVSSGPLKLDVVAGQAFLHGVDMQLTPKEFGMLLLLIRNGGKTLTKEKIYEEVWSAPMVGDDRTLKKHLSSLRQKLTASGFSVVSSRGEGYCLQVTVK